MALRMTMLQGRTKLLEKVLTPGWNKLSNVAGVRLLDDGTAMLFICGGTHWFDTITLQDSMSRWTFNLFGEKKVYGKGKECAPPRQTFIMRRQRPSGNAPSTFKYGDITVSYAPIYKHATSVPFNPVMQGMYPVTGSMQADTPGADGIVPVQGGEQDAQWLIGKSDAMIHRSNLAWLDMNTGEPTPHLTQPSYTGSRGWAKTTQIAEVCDLFNPNDVYDDRRKPKNMNTGECAYYPAMAGLDRYNSYGPKDWQHGIFTLGAVIAAAACGDLAAQFFLRIFAADARYCHGAAPAATLAKGSGYYGTRECAWVTTALLQARETRSLGLAHLDQMAVAQTGSGCIARLPSNYPFSPGPIGSPSWIQYHPDTPPPPGSDTWWWQPSMELWLTCHPLALEGRVEPIKRALQAVFESPWIDALGYVPKFLRVSRAEVYDTTIGITDGVPDYFPWVALGAYACLQMRDPAWLNWMLKITTPTQGKAISEERVIQMNPNLAGKPDQILKVRRADLLAKLRAETRHEGAGQVVAALSALEIISQ